MPKPGRRASPRLFGRMKLAGRGDVERRFRVDEAHEGEDHIVRGSSAASALPGAFWNYTPGRSVKGEALLASGRTSPAARPGA